MTDYSALRAVASEDFLPFLEMLETGMSHRQVALAFGKHHSYVDRQVARLQAKLVPPPPLAARDGTDPYLLDRVTTQVNAHGAVERFWLKTKLSEVKFRESLKEAVADFMAALTPLEVPPAPGLDFDEDIVPWINIGDGHLNMLAHLAIVHDSFDLETAERELHVGVAMLVAELPNCRRIVLNDLGDMTHAENIQGVTEGHGHRLDVDRPYPDMIRVYSRLMRRLVELCLEKAEFVDIIINQGNHSRKNDLWMAELLRVAFAGSNRVNVLDNESVFIGYRMGNTLVLTHHSDTCKPKRLAEVMTTDFRTDFGETEHHYIYIGHVHHSMVVKEHPSIFIESFNHLATLDKYAFEGGWRNRRSITVVFLSRTYGDRGRRVLPIQEIHDRILGTRRSVEARESRRAYSA